ncbi:MAG: DUF1800 family protein [Arenicellales bacterium]
MIILVVQRFSQWLTGRIKHVLLLSLMSFIAFQTPVVQAKLNEDDPALSAILSAIHLLLLDDTPGGPVKLGFDSLNSHHYGYNYGQGNYKDGLTLHFDAQSEPVTICFDAVDVQVGELTIELNSLQIDVLTSGHQCLTFQPNETHAGENNLTFIHHRPGERWGIHDILHDYERKHWLSLPSLTENEWNNLAVRKTLQVFAFGGHATDAQIQTWADMPADVAIKEMLNFEPHNLKLSPLPSGEKYPEPASLDGTFWGFRTYLGDLNSNLPIELHAVEEDNYERIGLRVDNYNTQGAWSRMATTRGLNPFRQKIGYWETNYHMAVNLDAAVTHRQLTYYYDTIMNAHEAGLPYKTVIAEAAKSAAVAMQYAHNENRWVQDSINGGYQNGPFICECNEDFAREIHQLFFGILGEQDPLGLSHHEDVTIPETAKALTDMRVDYDDDNERLPEVITFQTEYHHIEQVNVLNRMINGADAAAKIDHIADIAIAHPESLATLPILIVSGLADDDLSVDEQTQLRAAWASMPSKNFLEFVQAYAVSKLFHAPDRVKYFPSIDRFIYIANKLIHDNTEALLDLYDIASTYTPDRSFVAENVEVFRPLHNVFGGQTGVEASDAPVVMENNYNRFVVREYKQARTDCDDCDNGAPWLKDWAKIIPKQAGVYRADDVAQWLWQHFVGDGGKYYGAVERAHLVALMATDRDLNQLYCVQERRIAEGIVPSQSDINHNRTPLELLERDGPNPYRCDDELSAAEIVLLEKGFTTAELQATDMAALIDEMGNRIIDLESVDAHDREEANREIGQGINFILATPFIMAEEAQ